MSSPFLIPQHVADAVIAHAEAEAPNECCGFLAGNDGLITRCYPLINTAESPQTQFESSPNSTFAAAKEMRRLGVQVIAVYHSHPKDAAIPSAQDRERNYSAGVVNVIVSLAAAQPELRAWRIINDSVAEIEICIT
jgi:proteasome lid subunit RPN8/RPN11